MPCEKPPLLLIPGLLCDHRLWQAQTAALSSRVDIQVAEPTRHDTLYELARDILDRAPPRFALAGLSMGGYIAFEMLRQAPGRISRLALINTSARADSPDRIQRRLDFMSLATRGRFRGISHVMLPLLIHGGALDDPTVTQTVMAMCRETGADVFLRQQRAIIERPDSRPLLPMIHCPTLLIGGLDDSMTPPELTREMAAGVPHARLALLEDCGHLAPLEQPHRVNALMQAWLDDDITTVC